MAVYGCVLPEQDGILIEIETPQTDYRLLPLSTLLPSRFSPAIPGIPEQAFLPDPGHKVSFL
jgi:hypothetical protein